MHFEHCPNPSCKRFEEQKNDHWYFLFGSYTTKAFGTIPRFRCRECGRTFSTQTFSIDYYAKKKLPYLRIFQHLYTSSGLWDLARELSCRVESIQNRIERFSHTALAHHDSLLAKLPFKETYAADGLESFCYSQFFPHHIHLLAGQESQFIYGMNFVPLRRKGRMREDQKIRRKELEKAGKAKPSGIREGFTRLILDLGQNISREGISQTTLWTDEHEAYKTAFKNIHKTYPQILHRTISSRKARTIQNPLFAVNYLDRQIRKDQANHVRETIQFGRHPGAMMARMAVYRMFHNMVKPFRTHDQKRGLCRTHTKMAGWNGEEPEQMIQRRWGKREFFNKLKLNEDDKKTWFIGWRNPGQKSKRYVPKYYRA